MKKIRLYGYFCENFGDDLMIHILLTKYPDVFFCTYSDRYTHAFAKYPNFYSKESLRLKYDFLNHVLNYITRYKKQDFFVNWLMDRKMKDVDCSVYIGGSLYMQSKSSQEFLKNKTADDAEKLHSGNLFVIGANFGPYLTDEFKDFYKNYFRCCKSVTFRDRASYDLFSDLENVNYAPDVVFNLPKPEKKDHLHTGKIVLSVIDLKKKENLSCYSEIYEAFMADVCRLCLEKGKTPVLMSFCKAEGDENAVRRIRTKLSSQEDHQVEEYLYNGNIEEALEQIQTAERIVATRFHAMILAIRFGKPFYTIVYNRKQKNVLDDIQCEAYCEMKDLASLSPEDMFADMSDSMDIVDYMDQARHQFDQLDAFLAGKPL